MEYRVGLKHVQEDTGISLSIPERHCTLEKRVLNGMEKARASHRASEARRGSFGRGYYTQISSVRDLLILLGCDGRLYPARYMNQI
jgi:hypothetical protein